MSFKGCMDKGRSKVERLDVLVREMYALSLEHQCIISPEFVPTLENGAADFLSRPAVQLGDPIAQAESYIHQAPSSQRVQATALGRRLLRVLCKHQWLRCLDVV